MTRRALALALAMAPSVAAAQARDVPWYVQNHAARRATLEWCAADAERQDTRECRNARAAGAVDLMTPGHKWNRAAPVAPPPRPQPRPVAPKRDSPGRGPVRAA